jgi:hypothetical protein
MENWQSEIGQKSTHTLVWQAILIYFETLTHFPWVDLSVISNVFRGIEKPSNNNNNVQHTNGFVKDTSFIFLVCALFSSLCVSFLENDLADSYE